MWHGQPFCIVDRGLRFRKATAFRGVPASRIEWFRAATPRNGRSGRMPAPRPNASRKTGRVPAGGSDRRVRMSANTMSGTKSSGGQIIVVGLIVLTAVW